MAWIAEIDELLQLRICWAEISVKSTSIHLAPRIRNIRQYSLSCGRDRKKNKLSPVGIKCIHFIFTVVSSDFIPAKIDIFIGHTIHWAAFFWIQFLEPDVWFIPTGISDNFFLKTVSVGAWGTPINNIFMHRKPHTWMCFPFPPVAGWFNSDAPGIWKRLWIQWNCIAKL